MNVPTRNVFTRDGDDWLSEGVRPRVGKAREGTSGEEHTEQRAVRLGGEEGNGMIPWLEAQVDSTERHPRPSESPMLIADHAGDGDGSGSQAMNRQS